MTNLTKEEQQQIDKIKQCLICQYECVYRPIQDAKSNNEETLELPYKPKGKCKPGQEIKLICLPNDLELDKLENLEELNLSDNKLSNFENIRTALKNLKNVTINCRNNNFQEEADEEFEKWKNDNKITFKYKKTKKTKKQDATIKKKPSSKK